MHKRLSARRIGSLFVSVLVFMALAVGAASAETLRSYAAPSYYLGAGGQPPTLQQFAVEPRRYFRSEVAYRSFRAEALGGRDLALLLQQGRVQTVPCTGFIYTSGLTAAGEISWFERACYPREELIQVRDTGQWRTVASLGCLNLVRPDAALSPRAQMPPVSNWQNRGIRVVPHVYHVPDLNVCGCVHVPGVTFMQPGWQPLPGDGWDN